MTTQLTTLDKVRDWLSLNSYTDDALLSDLIIEVCDDIEEYLQRTIGQANYTRTLNGQGQTILFLPDYPVTAVSSVLVDGVAIAAATSATGNGYVFDEYSIVLRGYRFTRGVQNVSISYTAGYSDVPAKLQKAAKITVAHRYHERKRIGVSSKGLAGENVSFTLAAFPDDVLKTLDSMRRVIPV